MLTEKFIILYLWFCWETDYFHKNILVKYEIVSSNKLNQTLQELLLD